MGMTIDEAIKEIESIAVVIDEKQALAFALAVHTMKKYQMLQADYEARLKADMAAILEEIDLQFDEICFSKKGEWKTVPEIKAEYKAIIQQKINELKENKDG